jgi:hypothetical protein
MTIGFRASDARDFGTAESGCAPDGGVVIVYFALAIFVIMGMAAFVVDLGYWYYQAARIQRAADAASLAGVVYMPGDTADAFSVADHIAAANGFSAPADQVTVSPVLTDPHELTVQIKDPDVPTFFAKVFGIDSISETRLATAQYDPSVPLGSPENSLGTGNLPCTGISTTCENQANFWLGISGFCSAREDGDEFSTMYDGDRANGNTNCPIDPGGDDGESSTFVNPDYGSSGYTYDIDVPGNTVTTEDVTVEIYDPAYNPARLSGNDGDCVTTAQASIPDDSATGYGTGSCAAETNSQVDTNWLLYAPGYSSFDPNPGPIVAPPGASVADPGVFKTGDTTCENAWCSLYIIEAGSPAGTYQLHLWTTANQVDSYGTNQFALRAKVGDWYPTCGVTCSSGAVDTSTFTPCSTIAENGQPANPNCPEVHGDTAMSIFVDSAGTEECTPGTREEQSVQGAPVVDVSGPEPCASFWLAQISPDYAGRQMDITLFDPGEGATAIRILQPDGTPASFTYQTCDIGTPGCPTLEGTDSGAAYYSDDGNDPPTDTTTCICDTGLKPTPLNGRASPSKYNDRYLVIQTTIPSGNAITANDGWYSVQYTFNGSSVSDRTTWSVTVPGNPIHLVQ